ncbi:MAG: MBL fold metallo-hydrolase [Gemmatimonadota bacterium]|nr:MAG: MBL fold metallo-hydrolase [Gemmatimonadota bacterium]
MNSARLLGAVLISSFFVSNVLAQDLDQVQIATVKITDGVYMLIGYGGNIGVSVGEDGTLLIDNQFAEVKDKIDAALLEISPHPVRFVLNTNWHHDHVSGNAAFAESGAAVIAHERSQVRMLTDQRHPDLGIEVPPYPETALPVITINESLTLHLNEDELLVFHIPNAHSDADLAFYFRRANVMHTGDLCFVDGYPYIDILNGGSIDGTIAAMDRLISMIDDRTKVIPGHGPLTDLAGLQEYREMLTTVRDRVAEQISRGRSLAEILESNPTAGFDEGRDQFVPRELFVEIVYNSLTGRSPGQQGTGNRR